MGRGLVWGGLCEASLAAAGGFRVGGMVVAVGCLRPLLGLVNWRVLRRSSERRMWVTQPRS